MALKDQPYVKHGINSNKFEKKSHYVSLMAEKTHVIFAISLIKKLSSKGGSKQLRIVSYDFLVDIMQGGFKS